MDLRQLQGQVYTKRPKGKRAAPGDPVEEEEPDVDDGIEFANMLEGKRDRKSRVVMVSDI